MEKTMDKLKEIGRELGIKGVTMYKKEELVNKIISHMKGEGPSPKPPMKGLSREEYENMTFTNLKKIASELRIVGVYKLKLADKDGLIDEIMRRVIPYEEDEDIDASSDISTSVASDEEPEIPEDEEDETEDDTDEETDEETDEDEEEEEEKEEGGSAGPSNVFTVDYLKDQSLDKIIRIAESYGISIPDDADKEQAIYIMVQKRGSEDDKRTVELIRRDRIEKEQAMMREMERWKRGRGR